MRKITVAAIQMNCPGTVAENISHADKLVREAAEKGANIILLPELFERFYFCQERNYDYYKFAKPIDENDAVNRFKTVAKELGTVIIVSFYEKDGNVLYNSVAVIDADGKIAGVYRKNHIPDDHFYQEKFYFTPGNTGFHAFDTKFGRVGVGICWDQWFPETARLLALDGAEILFYPTAIGSEPILDTDSSAHWQRVMQGHSAANVIPVVAANRYGKETVIPSEANGNQSSSLVFYGTSFITDETGAVLEQASRTGDALLLHEFDLDEINKARFDWGLFRDRRPETYTNLTI